MSEIQGKYKIGKNLYLLIKRAGSLSTWNPPTPYLERDKGKPIVPRECIVTIPKPESQSDLKQ